MADETLNITVAEDNGATNKLVTAVNNLAQSSETLATATDRSVASSQNANTARATEAASTERAATAAKGYVDAQGNYIRLVGSQANGVQAAAQAQAGLTTALNSTSIEAGRAAAGYGPLNAGLSASQSAAAASRAAIAQLTAGLAGGATSAQAAGVGLNQVGAAGNAAAVGLANGRNAFQATATGAQAVGTAAAAAGTGLRAAGDGAGLAARGLVPVGTAAAAAAAASNQASNATRSLGAAFQAVGQSASSFGSLLAGLGLAVGAQQVIKYADSYTQASNKLRLVTTDQTKLNDIMNTAFAIAQKTATPFNDVANLYGKISQNANQYRLSAGDVAKVTESMSLAFQSSGASGVEAGRAITQFSQGLQKGRLEAQDFKSILESAPVVQNAMIAGLRMIGVTVTGSLTSALSQGTVSAKQMLDALVAINPTLQTFASGALPTVANAMTRVTNAFEQYIGTANQGNSITGSFIGVLNGLANNMSTVVPIAVGLGAVLAFGMVAGAITSIVGLASAFTTLTVAMAANPIALAAIGAAIAIGIPLWQRYGDNVKGFAANLIGVGPAAQSAQAGTAAAAASAGSLSGAYQNAQANVAAANARLAQTKAALDSAKAGTDAHSAAVGANNAAMAQASAAAAQVEAARKALDNQTQQNTNSEKQYAAAMNHIQNENAYGEKLQTISDFLSKARAAQEAWQRSLDATLAPLTAMAQASNQAAIAATGVSEAVAKAAAATQLGVSGFDQYGTEARNAAQNLQALTGDAGLFTQAQLDANSSINQGQSAASSAAGAISELGAAYRQAGNDAQFFAINSRDANTVAGQIGGSTASGLDLNSMQGLALGMNIPTNSTPNEVIATMTRRAYEALQRDPTNQAAIGYLSGQQSLRDQARKAQSAPGYEKYYNDDGSLKTQQELTAANSNNTSATAANTAALNANTAAANSNTASNASLPDLVAALDPRNSTVTTGLGADGKATVGTTVTQTNYLTPDRSIAEDTGPSPDVVMRLNGGFAPGPNAVLNPATGTLQDPAGTIPGFGQGNTVPRRAPTNVSIVVKADDFGQYQRSSRQIAQDIGNRVALAAS